MNPSTDGNGPTEDKTVADRNEHLVREYFQAVWNDGDMEPFDTDVVSDDYVMHHQSNAEYSRAAPRPAWADWHGGFPDLSNDIEDLIVTHDRVVIRYRFSATHEGKVMGIPAADRDVETAGIVIIRVEDGRIAEE